MFPTLAARPGRAGRVGRLLQHRAAAPVPRAWPPRRTVPPEPAARPATSPILDAAAPNRTGDDWVSRPVAANGVVCVAWQQVSVGKHRAGHRFDVLVTDQLLQFWIGNELLKTVARTSRGEVRKKRAWHQPARTNLEQSVNINRTRPRQGSTEAEQAHKTRKPAPVPLPRQTAVQARHASQHRAGRRPSKCSARRDPP